MTGFGECTYICAVIIKINPCMCKSAWTLENLWKLLLQPLIWYVYIDIYLYTYIFINSLEKKLCDIKLFKLFRRKTISYNNYSYHSLIYWSLSFTSSFVTHYFIYIIIIAWSAIAELKYYDIYLYVVTGRRSRS